MVLSILYMKFFKKSVGNIGILMNISDKVFLIIISTLLSLIFLFRVLIKVH